MTNDSTTAPAMKNAMMLSIALRLDPVMRLAISNVAGPAIAPNYSKIEKNPKNSDDRSRGIMLAKSDRLRAWLPPCTTATINARR